MSIYQSQVNNNHENDPVESLVEAVMKLEKLNASLEVIGAALDVLI